MASEARRNGSQELASGGGEATFHENTLLRTQENHFHTRSDSDESFVSTKTDTLKL